MKSVRTTVDLVTNQSLAATYSSPVFQIASYPLISVHWWLSAGSDTTGSMQVQVSDYEDNTTDGYLANTPPGWATTLSSYIPQWINLSSVKTFPTANAYTATAISNAVPVSEVINLDCTGFKFIRLVYTRTSGTGTLQVRVTGKRNKSSII